MEAGIEDYKEAVAELKGVLFTAILRLSEIVDSGNPEKMKIMNEIKNYLQEMKSKYSNL